MSQELHHFQTVTVLSDSLIWNAIPLGILQSGTEKMIRGIENIAKCNTGGKKKKALFTKVFCYPSPQQVAVRVF